MDVRELVDVRVDDEVPVAVLDEEDVFVDRPDTVDVRESIDVTVE